MNRHFFASLLSGLVALTLTETRALAEERLDADYEIAVHSGPLLPSRIKHVREIVQVVGLRGSTKTAKGIFELEGFTGRGNGIIYNAVSLDYRADIPNPYLPVHFLMGFHGDYYKPDNSNQFLFGSGWHFGGGVKQPIAGPIEFRADFKYRMSPGVSLYVGTSLVYLFGQGTGG